MRELWTLIQGAWVQIVAVLIAVNALFFGGYHVGHKFAEADCITEKLAVADAATAAVQVKLNDYQKTIATRDKTIAGFEREKAQLAADAIAHPARSVFLTTTRPAACTVHPLDNAHDTGTVGPRLGDVPQEFGPGIPTDHGPFLYGEADRANGYAVRLNALARLLEQCAAAHT